MNRINTWLKANHEDLQTGLALLSTILLLLYTGAHTASLLGRYAEYTPLAYLAAAAIEGAIVALSFRIGQLGWQAKEARFFQCVLIGALTVSALANMAEGYAVKYRTELVFSGIGQLDPVQGIIGIAATGALSVIVYALAEIIGRDAKQTTLTPTPSRRITHRSVRIYRPRPVLALPDAPPIEAVSIEVVPIVASTEAYVCGQCGASFEASGGLASHTRWKHPKPAPVVAEAA